MSRPFEFKEFTLQQEKSAFKLGTDSVLLGAWLPVSPYKKILDIGAGTGILSLMLAQRFAHANIIGVEIDSASVEDSANNFAQSKWAERLKIVHEDIAIWSPNNREERVDLIITNPPYFRNSLKNPDSRKSVARHSDNISNEIIVKLASTHLTEHGRFACILPNTEFSILKEAFEKDDYHLSNHCMVSSFENGEIIRSMGVFEKEPKSLKEEIQYLYNVDKSRSDWYKKISSEFYLK